MRVRNNSSYFAEWMLKIGRGVLSDEENLSDDFISLPNRCIVEADELSSAVFGVHNYVIHLCRYL